MRIVNLATFHQLPAGTVFQKYEPCVFGELCIKGESIRDHRDADLTYFDFYQTSLTDISFTGVSDDDSFGQACTDLESGAQRHVQLQRERDGDFKEDQLFAIWEKNDLSMLVERLAACTTVVA